MTDIKITITSLIAQLPDGSAGTCEWRLNAGTPNADSALTTISRIVEMDDQYDIYVLPKPDHPLGRHQIGIIHSIPRSCVRLVTTVAKLSEWAEMLAAAEEDEPEEEEAPATHANPSATPNGTAAASVQSSIRDPNIATLAALGVS